MSSKTSLEYLFQTSQMLGYPVNVGLVMRHLQQDMRDDWYKDTLSYADIFSDQEYAMYVIEKCLGQGGGTYRGDSRVVRSIPKKEFAERYSLETDFFDRFIYQSICTFLIPYLDPLLSHRVLSHRYNKNSSHSQYIFRNKISKWLDYEGLTHLFLGDGKYLAATDINNYYENISCEHVIGSLIELTNKCQCQSYEKAQIRSAIRTLDELLKRWAYDEKFGLPQNRDASSFLSNVLLCKVDNSMLASGYDYYRYVDDIRIICDTEQEARVSIQKTIEMLRTVGMNINTNKTNIISHASPSSDIDELFPTRKSLVVAVASMWRSRSRRVFIRSIEYVLQIIYESIDNGDTQSRSFRFAINRIRQLVEAGLFDVRDAAADELLEYAYASLKSDAVSSDQLCHLIQVLQPDEPYLHKLAEFLCDRDNCIHDWQNHHLWIYLATRKFDSENLRHVAVDILDEDPKSSEAASVFIWCQSVSFLSPIEDLIGEYDEKWPFQNQRYFLMAVSSCANSQQKRLRGKVPEKLLGTIKRARRKFREDGVAIKSPEKPSLSALFEDIKDYA